MSEHVVNNNPKKELLFALGGIGLFLGIVLLIGISAFLRPAGEHITAEPTEESVAADEAAVIAAEADTEEATVAEPVATDDADASIGAGEATADTAADATTTPTPSSNDAVIATGSATATADGTVDQAAAADADLTAEQADGDADATVDAEETAAE
ncbi:MAG: hypothetical protein ACPHVZ_04155 [Psychrobacter sp.]|jgi:hypothetical protein|uniref:hypothetical protein n=1 Tax=Psychrobacter TaxID=497 RepID=UPI001EDF4D7E|nr:hypothetical protein [Psychrobacter sp. Ps3]MCG3882162.1 hypothetical protein [Psychrobacter sp. Ps3]